MVYNNKSYTSSGEIRIEASACYVDCSEGINRFKCDFILLNDSNNSYQLAEMWLNCTDCTGRSYVTSGPFAEGDNLKPKGSSSYSGFFPSPAYFLTVSGYLGLVNLSTNEYCYAHLGPVGLFRTYQE
eukprot:TRINITY_DN2828_c0_g2_i13.p1 TRINITY_DN2828_c0_g2~~TRINITY_DN2828_c0_g2_i13.p1  ORF type:complete len:127 (-),score=8.12 TRINITY_DN2828_c0_g2_i13:55-435(-)